MLVTQSRKRKANPKQISLVLRASEIEQMRTDIVVVA